MKVKELIKELQNLPQNLQVCILDNQKNLNGDYGEGSYEGIYKDFEIIHMGEEGNSIPEGSPKWIALSFNDEDQSF